MTAVSFAGDSRHWLTASEDGSVKIWDRDNIDAAPAPVATYSMTDPRTGDPVPVVRGGFFTQPTNIGSRQSDEFSIMPEVQAKLSWHVIPQLRAFAAYNFLYWSDVARPGGQIDRGLNLSQSPEFGGGVLVGPARPAPLLNSTDFWAHGLSFGLELQF